MATLLEAALFSLTRMGRCMKLRCYLMRIMKYSYLQFELRLQKYTARKARHLQMTFEWSRGLGPPPKLLECVLFSNLQSGANAGM